MTWFLTLTFFASLALTSAQNPLASLGLSEQCNSALLQAFADPAASSCLNLPGVIPIVTNPANESFIPPVNSYLQGMCAASPCSNATLDALATNVTTGCSKELAGLGLLTTHINVTQAVESYYPVARRIGCLINTSINNTLCVTSTLTDIQTALGTPLSFNGIISGLLRNPLENNKNLTCTDCIQAAYTILKQDVPSLANNTKFTNEANKTCGNAFITGGIPANIQDPSGGSPSSSASPSGTGRPGAAQKRLDLAAMTVAIPTIIAGLILAL